MSCCYYSRTSQYRLFLTFLAFAAVDRIPFEPGLLCPLTGLLLEMKQIMYGELVLVYTEGITLLHTRLQIILTCGLFSLHVSWFCPRCSALNLQKCVRIKVSFSKTCHASVGFSQTLQSMALFFFTVCLIQRFIYLFFNEVCSIVKLIMK